MPLYEYQCVPNSHRFEVRHPITQEPVTECPVCGGAVRRVIHPVGIVFKGSGFYATDSRGKSVNSTAKASGDAGTEAKSSEASTGTQEQSKKTETGSKATEAPAKVTSSDAASGKPQSKTT